LQLPSTIAFYIFHLVFQIYLLVMGISDSLVLTAV